MRKAAIILSLAAATVLAGCAARSSSRAFAPAESSWTGPVLVSQAPIPPGIDYKVIGAVRANARVGYDSVTLLYPLLATEARKLGANAVISATGGHRVTAFSWAAGYVQGTAVRVEDPEQLKRLTGTYH